MPTVIVGGSARNVGKTSLICALIAVLPECRWTAIKITSHDHDKTTPIWEQIQPGQGTDTARYLEAGARRALLVTAHDGNVPRVELRAALGDDRWLIFETNQVQPLEKPDVVLALVGSEETESKPSFAAVVRYADAFVYAGSGPSSNQKDEPHRVFVLADLHRISPELLGWMRARLAICTPAR